MRTTVSWEGCGEGVRGLSRWTLERHTSISGNAVAEKDRHGVNRGGIASRARRWEKDMVDDRRIYATSILYGHRDMRRKENMVDSPA